MKTILVFTVLVAGICASIVPEPSFEPEALASRDSRFITGPIENQVIEAIEGISQDIRDIGLDPLHIKKETYVYELPVPVIFNAVAFLEEVLSTGLSDIVVNDMNYSLLWSRLTFELEIPHIHLSARAADGVVTLFGEKLTASVDGRCDIRGIFVKGEVRVNVGIISGISIRDVDIDLNVGQIISSIRLLILGNNYSQEITNFINQTVPATLAEFKSEIDELIGIVLKDIINENL
ncbi:hypothetical protein PYW07_014309 [Mythimna separata]|uniref:Uncharacterized protein n=1 Tax=Mythimna separata TaxID=271217 RepID=A0AAD7YZP9_MYTSE|nr:hypothetical protein PYW07_014309 [Mythimna separata]